ncbi:hypothetical protein HJG60_009656 [Phyllostomus discolor]|uniref:Uncharacterized protein n=1 Tax=Phyllostomus discolor TaxID=89673 RepID=A0A834B877_9CHIR|nr:hypothetical protein HJG60_009656 [Phyllostomus discolor]
MQIDANDMQMDHSKPGFANVLCQAASYEVHPRAGLCQKLTSGAQRPWGECLTAPPPSRRLFKTQRTAAPALPTPTWGSEILRKGGSFSPSRPQAPEGRGSPSFTTAPPDLAHSLAPSRHRGAAG